MAADIKGELVAWKSYQREYTGEKVTAPLKEETAIVKEGRRKGRGGEQVEIRLGVMTKGMSNPLFNNSHSLVLRSPFTSLASKHPSRRSPHGRSNPFDHRSQRGDLVKERSNATTFRVTPMIHMIHHEKLPVKRRTNPRAKIFAY